MFGDVLVRCAVLVLIGVSVMLMLSVTGCQPLPVCNEPYILVGTGCCLDRDGNKICDDDEADEAVDEPVDEPVDEVVEVYEQEESEESSEEEQGNATAEEDEPRFDVQDALKAVVLVQMKHYNKAAQKTGRNLSSGTGFFTSPDGYVLTNMHVVDPYRYGLTELDVMYTVKTADNVYDTQLIDWNWDHDIALLKLKEKKTKMKYLELGSSEKTGQGDTIHVLGNPMGLEKSVTKGIISAKGRAGLNNESVKAYMQTDAAVNRGNSGGPFINEKGEVVAIATYGYGWYNAGLNFGLESGKAKELYSIMKQNKLPIVTAPLKKCHEGPGEWFYSSSAYGHESLHKNMEFSKPDDISIFYDISSNSIKFNSIQLDFENKGAEQHKICFHGKIITDGKILMDRKLDTEITAKPNMILTNQEVRIGFTTPNRFQWYYTEINASDCSTGEQYYSFYRRDVYSEERETGDYRSFRAC